MSNYVLNGLFYAYNCWRPVINCHKLEQASKQFKSSFLAKKIYGRLHGHYTQNTLATTKKQSYHSSPKMVNKSTKKNCYTCMDNTVANNKVKKSPKLGWVEVSKFGMKYWFVVTVSKVCVDRLMKFKYNLK